MFNKIKLFAALSAAALALCACASDDAEGTPQEPEIDDGIMGVTYKGETEITSVRMDYMTAPETRSLGEIFTGEEHNEGHLVLRSQPNKRAGMYFHVMTSGPDTIPLASTIELSVDNTFTVGTRTFKYTVNESHGLLREIRLGITGGDWPNKKARVNAWKIVIKNPAGKTVVEKRSWLWTLDEEKKADDAAKAEAK